MTKEWRSPNDESLTTTGNPIFLSHIFLFHQQGVYRKDVGQKDVRNDRAEWRFESSCN